MEAVTLELCDNSKILTYLGRACLMSRDPPSVLLIPSQLILVVIAAVWLDRFSVPVIVVALGAGILLGSDVLNMWYFEDADLTNKVANLALVLILFQGGFATKRGNYRGDAFVILGGERSLVVDCTQEKGGTCVIQVSRSSEGRGKEVCATPMRRRVLPSKRMPFRQFVQSLPANCTV